MKHAMLTLLLALPALAACDAAQGDPPEVAVTQAWCRQAPAGAPTGACYLTLTANTDDRLVAVETPAAARVEAHEMDMAGGVMRMRRLDGGLALPRGEAVAFAPGGKHLMIVGPKAPMTAGTGVPLVLEFEKAPRRAVTATVR